MMAQFEVELRRRTKPRQENPSLWQVVEWVISKRLALAQGIGCGQFHQICSEQLRAQPHRLEWGLGWIEQPVSTVDSQLTAMWQQEQERRARQLHECHIRQRNDNHEAVRKQYMAANVHLLSTLRSSKEGEGLVPQDIRAVRRFLAAPTKWEGLQCYQDPEQKRILAAAMKHSREIIEKH